MAVRWFNPWSVPTRLVRLFFVLAFIAFGFGIVIALIAYATADNGGDGLLAAVLLLALWGFNGAVLLALSYMLRLLLVLEGRTRESVTS